MVLTMLERLSCFILLATFLVSCSPKDGEKLEKGSDALQRAEEPIKKLSDTYPPFEYIDVVQFKNELILLGTNTAETTNAEGELDYIITNELWSSANGIKWKKVNQNFLSHSKLFPMFVSDNNKLYIIGGSETKNSPTNEVWETTDTKTWVLTDVKVPFSPRIGGVIDVLNEKLVLLGGMDKNMKDLFDVWIQDSNRWNLLSADSGVSPGPEKTARSMSQNYILYFDHENSKIMSSMDAVNWNSHKLTMELFLEGRPVEVALLEYRNSFYLLFCPNLSGGALTFINGYLPTDVVYRSTDLENWELLSEKANAPYESDEMNVLMPYNGLPYHYKPVFIAFKNKLWVVAKEGDVWRSADGRVWDLVAGPAPVYEESPEPFYPER